MEETISLKEIFLTLKKRMLLILSLAVLAVTVSGVVSYFYLTPIFQASTQILVNKTTNQEMYTTSDVQTNLQLINTYNVIIKSPAILDIVANELDLGITGSQLSSMIVVGSENESQVVTVAVTSTDPEEAVLIANRTAEVFQREVKNIMSVDNVSILSKAEVAENPVPVKPEPLMNMAIALVVGLMMGVGLTFLLEYLDNTVKSENDLDQLLAVPLLGAVPVFNDKEDTKTHANHMSIRGEQLGA